MKLANRIHKFIKYIELNLSEFDKSIGAANGYIGKQIKNGGSIGSHILEKIISIYPSLNVYWLLTGKGDMLNTLNIGGKVGVNSIGNELNLSTDSGLYLINMQWDSIKAIIDIFNWDCTNMRDTKIPKSNISENPIRIDEYVCVQYYKEGMMPNIKAGTFLILRNIKELYLKDLDHNNIFIISTSTKTHIGRLTNSVGLDHFVLSKDNPDKWEYPDIRLEKAEITSFWHVKALICSQTTIKPQEKKLEKEMIAGIEKKLEKLEKEIERLNLGGKRTEL